MVGWNPWSTLCGRSHIVLVFDPVAADAGGGAYGTDGRRAAIVLDPALRRRERAAVLAHELVHDERGGACPTSPSMPPGWQAVVAREEHTVDRIAASRLVPLEQLRRFVDGRMDPVTVDDVADHFDVPVWVALRAIRFLR